jgi:NADH-quinone oxidoreductase subunit N
MNWTIAIPEIVLACCGMAILILGVFQRNDGFRLCSMLVIAALGLAGVLVVAGAQGPGYHGMVIADSFSTFCRLTILVASGLGVLVSMDFNQHPETGHQKLARFEYPVLILFATVGMMIMVSSNNLMTMYMGVELQSLSIYVLAAFARDTTRSSEAGLKYFVLGALASGLLLYGISLVYGFAGTTSFADLARGLADPASVSTGLIVGLVFVVAGLSFKSAAVPFHMWTPDVYEGAPTPVTAFMATAPKVAALALFVRVLIGPFGHLIGEWRQLIVLISIGSMLLSAFAAIGQMNIKRLMAYSSIGHVGYLMIGMAAGTAVGVRGVLIYLVTYVFMSAGIFACVIAMRRKGRSLESINDLAGLGKTDPALALAFIVFLFSLAGIPPFSGFWAKYFIFVAAVEQGMWALAVLGMAASGISAYYYIRIIKVMYFDAAEAPFDVRPMSLSVVAGAGALFTTFFFLFPAPLVSAAEAAAKVLFL